MVYLSGNHLSKAFISQKLLDDTDFTIESGDKIGIVGVNGTGKSTLLKILVGKETLDGGQIYKANGLTMGYLPQNPDFDSENSILQQVMGDLSKEQQEAKEYQCKSILTKLELFDYDAKIGTLSGGQKKRVALASALVHDVQLLILDEPTNHIDSEMVTFLESFLTSFRGSVLMVTHDRYFLDRVTNKIWELDHGKLYTYACNYTKFLQRKAQREEMAVASERKRQSLIAREVEWINQGPCARGTKSQYRIDRLKDLQQQSINLQKDTVSLSSMASRLGKKIVEIEHVFKSFGDLHLIRDFSYVLQREDRIGIIGRNGIGKSTLIKMIMGVLPPDHGSVSLGETVKVGYFSQECEDMDESLRTIDYVKNESDAIQTPEGVLTASQLLEKFLFGSDLQYTTISRLSGGERRRLYLLKILMGAPNVLILDEPTNDLDIETLTILEDYLLSFAGVVIMVSHDRYFLDKVANRIFSFEDDTIKIYVGGYTDWQIWREASAPKVEAMKEEKQPKAQKRTHKLKFSYKEQFEFDHIDEEIAALEQQIADTQNKLGQNASDFVRLQELTEQSEKLGAQLEEKMERWVYLNDLDEQIRAQNM